MNKILLEADRKQLIQKSKNGDNYVWYNQGRGKNRFARRLYSKIASSVRDYNSLNMNDLFRKDLLTINIHVTGETDDYLVRIQFKGFLSFVHKKLKQQNIEKIDLKIITKSLIEAFNQDDVYISCSCPDWKYRFGYWATKNNINSGPVENIPSDITNPNDTKGAGCKHVLLVINNNTWLIKVARVIKNYIEYMEKHYTKLYADIIFPAIYEKEYTKDVQLTLTDDELSDDSDTKVVDASNISARQKGQFKKGNKIGYRFAPNEKQKQLDFDKLENEQ